MCKSVSLPSSFENYTLPLTALAGGENKIGFLGLRPRLSMESSRNRFCPPSCFCVVVGFLTMPACTVEKQNVSWHGKLQLTSRKFILKNKKKRLTT